jgi:hypothetical protein
LRLACLKFRLLTAGGWRSLPYLHNPESGFAEFANIVAQPRS